MSRENPITESIRLCLQLVIIFNQTCWLPTFNVNARFSHSGNEDFDLTGPQNFSSNKLEAKTSIFDPVTFLEEEKHEINVPTLTTTLIGLCAFCVGIFGIKIHLDKVKQNKLFTDNQYSAVCNYKT
jgi:hypothetical protein